MGLFDTDTSGTTSSTVTRNLPTPSDVEQALILGGGGLAGQQTGYLGGLFPDQAMIGNALLYGLPQQQALPYGNIFQQRAPSFADYGGDVQGFLTSAYRNILGREPDPAGLQGWMQAIQSGQMTPDQALQGIMQSGESGQVGQRSLMQQAANAQIAQQNQIANNPYLQNILGITGGAMQGLQDYYAGKPLPTAQQGLINQQYDVAGQNFMRDIGDYFREQGQQRGLSPTDSPIANATAIAAARGLPQIEAARAAATQQQSNLNFQQNQGLLNFRNNLLQQSFANRLGLGQAQTPGLGLLQTLANTRLGAAGSTTSGRTGGSTSPGIQSYLPAIGGSLMGLPWDKITGGIGSLAGGVKDWFTGQNSPTALGTNANPFQDTSSLFPGAGQGFLGGGPSDYVSLPDLGNGSLVVE